MENQMENILVFATNIKSQSDKEKIGNLLDKKPEIQHWTLDQEDIDCVLRIVSDTLSEGQIIEFLANQNFRCTVLE